MFVRFTSVFVKFVLFIYLMPVPYFQFFELDVSSDQAWFDVRTSLDWSVVAVFRLSLAVFLVLWYYFGGNFQLIFVDIVDFILFIYFMRVLVACG